MISANISLYHVISEIFIICLIISLIWGSTNPLIKHSTKEISKIESSSKIKKLFYELKYLLFNWKYVLLFLINQSGSLLYFILLQSADLSLVVPLTNALTLIATGIFGVILGEEKPSKSEYFELHFFLKSCN